MNNHTGQLDTVNAMHTIERYGIEVAQARLMDLAVAPAQNAVLRVWIQSVAVTTVQGDRMHS